MRASVFVVADFLTSSCDVNSDGFFFAYFASYGPAVKVKRIFHINITFVLYKIYTTKNIKQVIQRMDIVILVNACTLHPAV